jgi:hypothetical protein
VIVDQIKARLRNGFHPFTLHLSDGKSFAVPHRDFIALATRVIVVIDESEIAHTLNPLHVVSIEDSTSGDQSRPRTSK